MDVMQYVNFVYGEDDETELNTAPVPVDDAAYLQRVIAELRPLSDEEYMTGPAVILHTMAKYSYVLSGDVLYWCVEWDPGLIVIRFSPDEDMSWVAVRSPVPNFGGREANQSDWDAYDVEAENPQYNLIFDPWDAQFDDQQRIWKSFVPVDSDVQGRFQRALTQVNTLGELMEKRFGDDLPTWTETSKKNVESWCSEGIRLE